MKDDTFLNNHHRHPGDKPNNNEPTSSAQSNPYKDLRGPWEYGSNMIGSLGSELETLDDENDYEHLQDSYSDDYGSEERW